MRILTSLVLSLALATPAMADEQTSAVDFLAINSLFANLVAPIVAGDDFVNAMTVAFDEEYSNLDENRVALNGTAQFAASRWSTEPTTIGAGVKFWATPGEERVRYDLTASVSVSSDTLALVKFLAKEAYSEGDCDNVVVNDTEDSVEARLCEVLKGVDSVSTMEELVDREAEAAALALTELNNEIAKLKQQISDAQGDEVEGLGEDLAEARSLRDAVMALERRVVRNDEGQFESYTLKLNDYDADWFDLESTTLVVTADSVSVEFHLGSEDETVHFYYSTFKPEVEKFMLELQNADEEGQDDIREGLKFYLELLKEIAQGDVD